MTDYPRRPRHRRLNGPELAGSIIYALFVIGLTAWVTFMVATAIAGPIAAGIVGK